MEDAALRAGQLQDRAGSVRASFLLLAAKLRGAGWAGPSFCTSRLLVLRWAAERRPCSPSRPKRREQVVLPQAVSSPQVLRSVAQ